MATMAYAATGFGGDLAHATAATPNEMGMVPRGMAQPWNGVKGGRAAADVDWNACAAGHNASSTSRLLQACDYEDDYGASGECGKPAGAVEQSGGKFSQALSGMRQKAAEQVARLTSNVRGGGGQHVQLQEDDATVTLEEVFGRHDAGIAEKWVSGIEEDPEAGCGPDPVATPPARNLPGAASVPKLAPFKVQAEMPTVFSMAQGLGADGRTCQEAIALVEEIDRQVLLLPRERQQELGEQWNEEPDLGDAAAFMGALGMDGQDSGMSLAEGVLNCLAGLLNAGLIKQCQNLWKGKQWIKAVLAVAGMDASNLDGVTALHFSTILGAATNFAKQMHSRPEARALLSRFAKHLKGLYEREIRRENKDADLVAIAGETRAMAEQTLGELFVESILALDNTDNGAKAAESLVGQLANILGEKQALPLQAMCSNLVGSETGQQLSKNSKLRTLADMVEEVFTFLCSRLFHARQAALLTDPLRMCTEYALADSFSAAIAAAIKEVWERNNMTSVFEANQNMHDKLRDQMCKTLGSTRAQGTDAITGLCKFMNDEAPRACRNARPHSSRETQQDTTSFTHPMDDTNTVRQMEQEMTMVMLEEIAQQLGAEIIRSGPVSATQQGIAERHLQVITRADERMKRFDGWSLSSNGVVEVDGKPVYNNVAQQVIYCAALSVVSEQQQKMKADSANPIGELLAQTEGHKTKWEDLVGNDGSEWRVFFEELYGNDEAPEGVPDSRAAAGKEFVLALAKEIVDRKLDDGKMNHDEIVATLDRNDLASDAIHQMVRDKIQSRQSRRDVKIGRINVDLHRRGERIVQDMLEGLRQ